MVKTVLVRMLATVVAAVGARALVKRRVRAMEAVAAAMGAEALTRCRQQVMVTIVHARGPQPLAKRQLLSNMLCHPPSKHLMDIPSFRSLVDMLHCQRPIRTCSYLGVLPRRRCNFLRSCKMRPQRLFASCVCKRHPQTSMAHLQSCHKSTCITPPHSCNPHPRRHHTHLSCPDTAENLGSAQLLQLLGLVVLGLGLVEPRWIRCVLLREERSGWKCPTPQPLVPPARVRRGQRGWCGP